MIKQRAKIEDVLERLYARYNHREFIKPDPLQFVYEYCNCADKEIVAFLSAQLAYGRVEQIEKGLKDLLGRMGDSPFGFVRDFNERKRTAMKDFKHRFTSGDDISDLLVLLKEVLQQYSSIEDFFIQGYSRSDRNTIPALAKFCDSLLAGYAETHNGNVSGGVSYLLPRPAKGSACKRLNLFLRWMVRSDQVDVGLWEKVDKRKLIVPVDVHIGRLCRILGFHTQRTVSIKTALEITDAFAEIEPTDPVKYDFALSRIGILENCTGQCRSGCESCELFGFCRSK